MDKSYTPRLEHKNPDTPAILDRCISIKGIGFRKSTVFGLSDCSDVGKNRAFC